MANPTAQSVMDLIVAAIKSGAEMPIDDAALKAFRNKYHVTFETALQAPANQPNGWATAQQNVLNAARQHGIIAAAIAHLHSAPSIDTRMLNRAGHTVEQECHLRFGQGAWCA